MSPLFSGVFSEAKHQLSLKARAAQKCGSINGQGYNLNQGAKRAAVSMLWPPIFPKEESGCRTEPQMPTAPTFITHFYIGFSSLPAFLPAPSPLLPGSFPNKQHALNSLLQAMLSGEPEIMRWSFRLFLGLSFSICKMRKWK